MEDQLVQLLSATQTAQEGPRKHAEQQLLSYYGHQELPLRLVSIACHDNVPLNIRQAALLYMKQLVLAGWSSSFEEYKGQLLVSEENKPLIRQQLLALATTDQLDRKLKAASGLVVSKIANSDYPDQWPDLLDNLLQLIPVATDGQLHGALKVLNELVEDCFNEATFFGIAPQLVKVIYDVAVSEQRRPVLRALACSVFRGCFDILEMVLEDHKTMVKSFADEILKEWIPFFVNTLKTRLPEPPSFQDDEADSEGAETFKGMVALKLQVVKVGGFSSYNWRMLIFSDTHAHTVRLPCHPLAAKSRPLPGDMGGVVATTTCILAHVHSRGAPEQTRGCGRSAIHTRLPCTGGARLYAGMFASTSSSRTARTRACDTDTGDVMGNRSHETRCRLCANHHRRGGSVGH
jgi:hypothetical protein